MQAKLDRGERGGVISAVVCLAMNIKKTSIISEISCLVTLNLINIVDDIEQGKPEEDAHNLMHNNRTQSTLSTQGPGMRS